MSLFKLPLKLKNSSIIASGENIINGQILARGRIYTKQIKIKIDRDFYNSSNSRKLNLLKKIGDSIYLGEILAKKDGTLFKQVKFLKSPVEGIIEEIREEERELIIGTFPLNYVLNSPGLGKVIELNEEEIVIDFEGEELTDIETFGTTAFGEVVFLSDKEREDYSGITSLHKDKILVSSIWDKYGVIKANTVGVSGIIGEVFTFSLNEEAKTLLRPLDPEGNAGFSLVKLNNHEQWEKIDKQKGKMLIISSQDTKLCLLKE